MRRQHTLVRSGLVLFFILVACGCGFAQQSTWQNVDRIVAIGDIHGDFGQFVKTLKAAGVIDDKMNWTGGKTHLVQTGDVFDRGPESRKAMDLLMRLEVQAAKAGGAVHPLIGNHEEMVLRGDWKYTTPAEIEAFGGADGYRAALAPEGKYGKWIRSHNAVIKINDVLFLHAGLNPNYATKSLDELNDGVRKGLSGGGGMARDSAGPLWYRGLAEGADDAVAAQAETIFKTFGVDHVVIGHTVAGKVTPKAGGKVVMIDVGMSSAYHGPASCLVIEKGKFYAATFGKPKEELPIQTKARANAAGE